MFNVLGIADIHFGAMDGAKLLEELNKSFIKKLEKDKTIHMVVLCGDLTDKALSYNDASINQLLQFINRVAYICEQRDIIFRIIKGTNTHDRNQLENYRYLETNPHLNFRIINKKELEIVGPELRIFYLPEDYNIDYDEIPDGIDFCFGHGDINFLSYGGKVLDSKNSFSAKRLTEKIKQCGIFGHYHQFQEYEDKLFYIGSFSRWMFGEEAKKGFIKLQYDEEKDETTIQFIENKFCDLFLTIDITGIINDEAIADKDKVRSIQKIIAHTQEQQSNRTVHIRVSVDHNQIKSLEQIDNSNRIIELVLKQDKDIKFHTLQNRSMVKKDEEQEEQERELRNSKYSFLFSNDLDSLSKIKKYIKVKYNKTLSLDRIQSFLSSE